MQSCCQGFRFPLVFSLVFSFFFSSVFFTEMSRLRAGKKGTHMHWTLSLTEMGGEEQQGGGGLRRVVVAHRLQSTFCIIHQPLPCFFFFLFRPAPSYCRKYQRHQLFFNLHSIHFPVECLNTNEGRDFCPLFDQCRLSHSHEGVVLEASRMHWGYLNKYSASTDHTKRWKWRERRDDTAEWSCGGT